MRKTTKLMLALALAGSLGLTSCKDYTEEEYSEVVLTVSERLKANQALMDQMQQDISDLTARLNSYQCPVTITKNSNGTYTISNGKETVTVPADAAEKPQQDANGYYVFDAAGNKIYIPTVITKDGKTYIVIAGNEYEFPTPAAPVTESPKITIDGDKITIESDGKKWEFEKPNSSGACECNIHLTYEDGKYYISEGDLKVEIPTSAGSSTCTCEFVDNNDGTVTLKQDGKDVITLKKNPTDVWAGTNADGNKVIYIQKYNADGTKGELEEIVIPKENTGGETIDHDKFATAEQLNQLLKELYGEGGTAAAPADNSLADKLNKVIATVGDENGGLVKDVQEVQSDLDAIETALYGENGTPENPKEGSVMYRLNDLESRVSTLEGNVADLADALKKLVTGVIVQQVNNPVFGSYSSLLTNVQTDILVAYHGTATQRIDFPTIDPQANESYWAGDVTLNNTPGNAGAVYATINPNTVDFTGVKLELVNSNDEPCGIELGNAIKTSSANDPLKFGFNTRSAENNGLYILPATLSEKAVNDSKLHINIDAAKAKKLLTDAIHVRKAGDVKPVMSDLAQVVLDVAQAVQLDKQGVKCSWEDKQGEHSVYSKYEIAAVAFQPLGFYTVDGIFADGGQYWRGYDKAKTLIDKLAKKVGKKIVNQIEKNANLKNINADLDNIKIDSIDYVVISDDAMKLHLTIDTIVKLNIKVDANVDLDQALEEIQIPIDFKYNQATGDIEATEYKTVAALKDEKAIKVNAIVKEGEAGDKDVQTIEIHFVKNFNVDMTEKIRAIMEQINAGFSDTNDLLDALNQLMKDAKDMIKNIRNLEDKLENATYLPRVYKYLDKVATAVGKYTPMLFKPALFVNSADGFGLVGGSATPAVVSSTQVTLIPTTYSGEILAPVFKKYIRVNGVGGKIVDGKTVDVTLKKGLNVIEYYALDYQAKQYPDADNEDAGKFYIYVK